MVEIVEVITKKQIKEFLKFPNVLYKDCNYYSYPLAMDEKNMFNAKKNVAYKDCDVVLFLAYQDGKVAGRIAGIIQKAYNKKANSKVARFTRFDAVNSQEVANALFDAVEKWAKNKGMETLVGPLGFNDLDVEGMIVEGFNERCTFEERYNYEYYVSLMENAGFTKDVDWLERKIYPTETTEKVARVAEICAKRYNLRFAKEKSKNELIEKYKKGIFDLVDEAYKDLYGTVPFTDEIREQLLGQFKTFVDLKFMIIVVNEKDEVVGFGVALPALNNALFKSKGKLTLPALFRVLKALKKPKVVDFALLAVRPDYQTKGVNAFAIKYLMDNMAKFGVEYCETNICLEDNIKINQTWQYFKHDQHRRRRSWKKELV